MNKNLYIVSIIGYNGYSFGVKTTLTDNDSIFNLIKERNIFNTDVDSNSVSIEPTDGLNTPYPYTYTDIDVKPLEERKKAIIDYLASHGDELEITSEGNYPILDEEEMLLTTNEVYRFYGSEVMERCVNWNDVDADELELIEDALAYNNIIVV